MAMDLGNDFGGISYSPKKKDEEEKKFNWGGGSSGGGGNIGKAADFLNPSKSEPRSGGSGSSSNAGGVFLNGEIARRNEGSGSEGSIREGLDSGGQSWEPPAAEEQPAAEEPSGGGEPQPTEETGTVPQAVQSPVVSETLAEATEESSGNGNVGNRTQESKPVVYEGGGLRTAKDRMANVNLKQELEEETSTGGLPADFWNWSAERQQAYLSNPDNMAAAIGQANRQAEQARRDAAVERANRATRENAINRAGMAAAAQAAGGGPARNYQSTFQFDPGLTVENLEGQHYLGAGPAEPGTWNYSTATGPQLEREVPAHDYRSTYQYDPNLTVENLTVNNPQWLAENGLSWAGAGAGQSPVDAQQEAGPVRPGALNLTRVSDDYPGGYQAMFEDGVRIRMDRGESREEAEANTRADILRQNLLAAGGTSNPNVIRFEPGAGASEQVPSTRDYGWLGYNIGKLGQSAANLGSYEDFLAANLRDRAFASEDERVRAERELAQQYNEMAAAGEIPGLVTSQDVLEKIYPAPGTYEDALKNAESSGYAPGTAEFDQSVSEYMRENRNQNGGERNGEPGNQRFVYRGGGPAAGGQETGQGGEAQLGGQSPVPASRQQEAGPVRPGVDAEVNSWDEKNGLHYMGAGPAEPGTENYTTATGPKSGGAGNGSGTAVVNTGGSGSGGTSTGESSSEIPKGSLKLKPTYGQGGTVVKAPYKSGGYTEEELIKMGNNSYGKRYGDKVYEGYYKAPDGKYYPVDQEKANYYRQNGTYNGWQEGMRDYYKTFGTFYGYRPDWKSAGRNTGSNRSYSYRGGGGYSYSGGSAGRSYGAGSTANNGLYWNPNTSWSI